MSEMEVDPPKGEEGNGTSSPSPSPSFGAQELSALLQLLAKEIEQSDVKAQTSVPVRDILAEEHGDRPVPLGERMEHVKRLIVDFEDAYYRDGFTLSRSPVTGPGATAQKGPKSCELKPIVSIKNLNFKYNKDIWVLNNCSMEILPKQRIFLVGLNGSGKSSLLRCLSGSHIVDFEEFHIEGLETNKAGSCALPWSDQFRGLAYLGPVFRRAGGFNVWEAYARDIAARDMMKHWQEDNLERRDELVKVLGINLDWRMHQVSDGQRKKVRIMLKLLKPFRLCVVDEFAAELDILARKRFFDYLAKECEERGAAVIYATHIFDLPGWATHIAFMKEKTVSPIYDLAVYPPYQRLVKARVSFPLYRIVINFMIEQQPMGLYRGDMREAEEMRAVIDNPYDTGFESGRFQLTEPSTKLTMKEAIDARKKTTS